MGRYEIDFLEEYTDEALLAELRRVAALVPSGQRLTQATYEKQGGRASRVTFLRKFGGWKQALEKAGLDHLHGSYPQLTSQLTDSGCFENLASVWTHYGRPPQYREMFRAPSAIQGKTYVTRWGTWRKALKAFVDWANSEASSEPIPVSEQPMAVVTPAAHKSRTEADCRDVRPGLRFKVFMRDRFRCVACGRSPATHLNIELHADHVRSVVDDGKTTLENLQTLCRDCNLGKGRISIK
jgi:hypothetical protein